MATGPGKYDHLATLVRDQTAAAAVIVVVFGGTDGSGFSVQAPEGFASQLPDLLRSLATKIEADL